MMRALCRAAAVLGLLLSVCNALSYRTCASSQGRVVDMFIPGCETGPCIMHRGQTMTIHIVFVPYISVGQVTTKVLINVSGFTISVPLAQPNACVDSLRCPLVPNNKYEYTSNITIYNSYPSFSGTVRWELRDEQGQDLVCAEFPGGIS